MLAETGSRKTAFNDPKPRHQHEAFPGRRQLDHLRAQALRLIGLDGPLRYRVGRDKHPALIGQSPPAPAEPVTQPAFDLVHRPRSQTRRDEFWYLFSLGTIESGSFAKIALCQQAPHPTRCTCVIFSRNLTSCKLTP